MSSDEHNALVTGMTEANVPKYGGSPGWRALDTAALNGEAHVTAPFAGRIYVPGTPVFDRIGFWIGIVDTASVEAGALIMRPNWFARERLPLPPESIVLSESDGVYLNIHSPTLAEWR